MTDLDLYTYNKIVEGINKKKEQHFADPVLTYIELQHSVILDFKNSLNNLYKEKKIKVSQGLNDKLISLNQLDK